MGNSNGKGFNKKTRKGRRKKKSKDKTSNSNEVSESSGSLNDAGSNAEVLTKTSTEDRKARIARESEIDDAIEEESEDESEAESEYEDEEVSERAYKSLDSYGYDYIDGKAAYQERASCQNPYYTCQTECLGYAPLRNNIPYEVPLYKCVGCPTGTPADFLYYLQSCDQVFFYTPVEYMNMGMTYANTQTDFTSDYLVSNHWYYRAMVFSFNNSSTALGLGRSDYLFGNARNIATRPAFILTGTVYMLTAYNTTLAGKRTPQTISMQGNDQNLSGQYPFVMTIANTGQINMQIWNKEVKEERCCIDASCCDIFLANMDNSPCCPLPPWKERKRKEQHDKVNCLGSQDPDSPYCPFVKDKSKVVDTTNTQTSLDDTQSRLLANMTERAQMMINPDDINLNQLCANVSPIDSRQGKFCRNPGNPNCGGQWLDFASGSLECGAECNYRFALNFQQNVIVEGRARDETYINPTCTPGELNKLLVALKTGLKFTEIAKKYPKCILTKPEQSYFRRPACLGQFGVLCNACSDSRVVPIYDSIYNDYVNQGREAAEKADPEAFRKNLNNNVNFVNTDLVAYVSPDEFITFVALQQKMIERRRRRRNNAFLLSERIRRANMVTQRMQHLKKKPPAVAKEGEAFEVRGKAKSVEYGFTAPSQETSSSEAETSSGDAEPLSGDAEVLNLLKKYGLSLPSGLQDNSPTEVMGRYGLNLSALGKKEKTD